MTLLLFPFYVWLDSNLLLHQKDLDSIIKNNILYFVKQCPKKIQYQIYINLFEYKNTLIY